MRDTLIIAEAGVNHNGSIDLAHQLIDMAAEAGADAVKFQTFNALSLVSPEAPKAEYQIRNTDSAESQLQMIRRLELSPDMHRDLVAYCRDRQILFMSSPFDLESAELLAELDVPAFKIPSGEITNFPLLQHVAHQGKPLIVSTGMAYLSEVEAAVRVIQKAGNWQYVLLHCVSNYPAEPADVNLKAMDTMNAAFGAPVGYSDHTMGTEIPIAAVALGASVIEKHLTMDRSLPGPDHGASLQPKEFAAMVEGIRRVESAIGHGRKEPANSEANTASVARKSLVAAKNIPAGTILTEGLVAIKRPGTGLAPVMLPYLVGRKARTVIPEGALITLELLK